MLLFRSILFAAAAFVTVVSAVPTPDVDSTTSLLQGVPVIDGLLDTPYPSSAAAVHLALMEAPNLSEEAALLPSETFHLAVSSSRNAMTILHSSLLRLVSSLIFLFF